MDSKCNIAEKIFAEGFNCAQASFYPFAVMNGIEPELALKLTTGFGAGMVYRGETCGAITGSMMAIGLFKGRSQSSDHDSKDYTYLLINELYKRFKVKHGTIICKELLNIDCNLKDNWDNAEMLFSTKCPYFVKDAVLITEELLNNCKNGIKRDTQKYC
jgi:C_GCAxxG_C_C family probable redox protein